jgi:hypothetical protein
VRKSPSLFLSGERGGFAGLDESLIDYNYMFWFLIK